MASFEFIADDDEHAYQVLTNDLPPLDNLKIDSVTLVGVDPEQLKSLN